MIVKDRTLVDEDVQLALNLILFGLLWHFSGLNQLMTGNLQRKQTYYGGTQNHRQSEPTASTELKKSIRTQYSTLELMCLEYDWLRNNAKGSPYL